jgi:hypothetical protein
MMGSVPVISLFQVINFLKGAHVPPSQHKVFIDDVEKGVCTKASVRTVLSLGGLEIPVDYAYTLDGSETTLSARLRTQGLGAGGREQIKVNGHDVQSDDVVISFDGSHGNAVVEFRFTDENRAQRVKFVAPLTGINT